MTVSMSDNAGVCRVRSGSGRSQLARLFRLVLMLQSERFPNARELAERCEVSRRTIYRDLDLLSDSGIPVKYRPERQGYQLAKGFFLPPTNLEEKEALALLVLASQWEAGDGLGLLRHARAGAGKVAQGLPPEARERVLVAAEPFRRGAAGSDAAPPDRQAVHEAVLAALPGLRQIRVWFRAPGTSTDECTKFSLYRVLLHDRRWFLVGRSTLHRRVEVIGLSWVWKVTVTDDRYVVPPRFNLERFLANAWGIRRGPVRVPVRLRFSSLMAPELRDRVWHRSQTRVEVGDGRVELHFVVDGLEEILWWVLGFGDQVEVLAPRELRFKVGEIGANVARLHGR